MQSSQTWVKRNIWRKLPGGFLRSLNRPIFASAVAKTRATVIATRQPNLTILRAAFFLVNHTEWSFTASLFVNTIINLVTENDHDCYSDWLDVRPHHRLSGDTSEVYANNMEFRGRRGVISYCAKWWGSIPPFWQINANEGKLFFSDSGTSSPPSLLHVNFCSWRVFSQRGYTVHMTKHPK